MSQEQDAKHTPPRNEPCPCGSGRKYKRCHGADAEPKREAVAAPAGGFPGMGAGMNPQELLKNMDPAWTQQVQSVMQRMPRAQLHRLQSMMQKAMSGQDISQEAATLEKTLPPEFQSLMMQAFAASGGQIPGMPDLGAPGAASTGPMTEDAARGIVEDAVKRGEITAEEAARALGVTAAEVEAGLASKNTSGGFLSKLWKKK